MIALAIKKESFSPHLTTFDRVSCFQFVISKMICNSIGY